MSKKVVFLFVGIVIFAFLYLHSLSSHKSLATMAKYQFSLVNLEHIRLGLWMYAQDHNDVFPDNLKQIDAYLYKEYEDVIVSPLKPKDFDGLSYIYISGHSFKDTESQEKYIIVYENPEYLTGYEHQQVNVLYLEGYVDRFKKEDFLSKLKATYEHLGKPMPEVKFKD